MPFEKPYLQPSVETRIFKGAEILYISYPYNQAKENVNVSEINLSNGVIFETVKANNQITEIWIQLPYKSDKIQFEYSQNKYIDQAQQVAKEQSLDEKMPNASVIVNNGKVIGFGANGSSYHTTHGCERVKLGIPTGQGYELCEGCHPKNHGEQTAIKNVYQKNNQALLAGSTLYMHGHWWCCSSCSDLMEKEGIKKVVIGKDWVKKFLEIEGK